MTTPSLQTKRLSLIPYTTDLVSQNHVNWLNDLEVVKYSEQRHMHHSFTSQINYVAKFISYGDHLWLIRTKNKDIGSITLHVNNYNCRGNMGIMIGDKTQWGNGYGLEAWMEVLQFGLNKLGLHKVECGTMEPNLGMRRIAENGMELEGILEDHFLVEGKNTALMLYGVSRFYQKVAE